jgi:Tol biopolymer transport system component
LALGGENGVSAAISPRGHRLAFAEPRRDADIWRLELGGRSRPAVRIASSPQWETHAQYSPDGRKIAFRSDRSGTSEVWVCDQDGANPVKVTSFGGPATGQPTWSPDGKTLAFVSRPEKNADIYVIGLEEGELRRITTDRSADLRPSWSPDGEWLYFLSFRSGDGEIWRAPVQGGELVQITHSGALQPVPSHDGKQLYYSRFTSGLVSLWKVSIEGGQPVQAVDSLLNRGSFAVTDQGVFFVRPPDADGTHSLRFLDGNNGQTRRITILPEGNFLRFSVSPNGRHLLYRRVYEATSDLMLVEGFR